MIIKIEYKIRIRKDDVFLLELATANRKAGRPVKVTTILRWLKDDSPMLTTVTNVAIIKRFLTLKDNEELFEETIGEEV